MKLELKLELQRNPVMKDIKIYFGVHIEDADWIDELLTGYLIDFDYDIDKAVDVMLSTLQPGTYYTFNPLIPNFYTDKVGAELFWILDLEGNHINFKDDKHLMGKLEWYSVGDALCDDFRVFPKGDKDD